MPPVPPKPPGLRPRRAKANLGAAQRRRKVDTLTPGDHVDHGPASVPATKPPAVKPGPVIKQERQPTTTPGRGRTRVNTGSAETQTTGYGVDRIGKKFQVAYLGNGRVAHLYGNDVPADQRRQVFSRAARRRAS